MDRGLAGNGADEFIGFVSAKASFIVRDDDDDDVYLELCLREPVEGKGIWEALVWLGVGNVSALSRDATLPRS